ncbi:MAG: hypothetical protein ABIA63_15335, partial [bacterium]
MFILFLLLIAALSHGWGIHGYVQNSLGKSLENVKVEILELGCAALSDSAGYFILDSLKGKDLTFCLAKDGYNELCTEIDSLRDTVFNFNFTLIPEHKSLADFMAPEKPGISPAVRPEKEERDESLFDKKDGERQVKLSKLIVRGRRIQE